MNKHLGTDIALDADGDLMIDPGTGDFSMVEGMECLLQDISEGLAMHPGALLDAPWEGILVPRESASDENTAQKLNRRYTDFLSSDERIIPESITIQRNADTGRIEASFDTVSGEKYEGGL